MNGQTTIPYAIDSDGKKHLATTLCELPDATVSEMRIRAVAANKIFNFFFGCPGCGHAIYPHKLGTTHWAHFPSALTDDVKCIYRTENPITKEQLEASMYGGRQTGSRHIELANQLAELLALDAAVLTESIKTDKTYIQSNIPGIRGRFPDVICDTIHGKLAIEVQLSPIYLYRLVDRTQFYESKGVKLLWLTETADHFGQLPTYFWDIVASQGLQAFDLPIEIYKLGQVKNQFVLRRHSNLVNIKNIKIETVDLNTIMDVKKSFETRWLESQQLHSLPEEPECRKLISELRTSQAITTAHLSDYDIYCVINWLLSIKLHKPIGSKVANSKSVVNNALNSEFGKRCVGLIEKAIVEYDPELLNSTRSIQNKISQARHWLSSPSATGGAFGRSGPVEKVRRFLLPNWKLSEPKTPYPAGPDTID